MLYEGIDEERLRSLLSAPKCAVFHQVTSTLDVIHELAKAGAPAGTIVLAEEQVAGRGRQGRSWYSPPGAGIWLGYLARPHAVPESGVMALRVGLAVCDALEELGIEACLKWPNDVMVAERKAAGILCEARWLGGKTGWIAVGVGINVHGPMPPALASDAAALDEVCDTISRIAVLERLVPRLHRLEGGSQLSDEERAAYAGRDWLAGRRLSEPVAGVARGVAENGALLVERHDGIHRVTGGTVVMA